MLKTRILVALVFLPFFVWLIFLSNPLPLFILITLALIASLIEMGLLVRHRGIRVDWAVSVVAGVAICFIASWAPLQTPGRVVSVFPGIWAISLAALLLLAWREVLGGFDEKNLINISAGVLPIWVIAGIGSFVFLLRRLPQGSDWVFMLFCFNWVYDAAAMFSGRFFGRRKLAPTISPAKTVEGMIGGLLVNAGLAAVLFFFWVPRQLGFSLPGFISLGILMGLLAQAGDLVESMVKRWSGAKDASGLIPGHGGVLDKIDNILFSAPILYFVAWFLTTP